MPGTCSFFRAHRVSRFHSNMHCLLFQKVDTDGWCGSEQIMLRRMQLRRPATIVWHGTQAFRYSDASWRFFDSSGEMQCDDYRKVMC
jgi:hypothetical protein